MTSDLYVDPSQAIRRLTNADAPALAEIAARPFAETFGSLYPAQDLDDYLATNCMPQVCARLLNEPGSAAWFASVDDSSPVGFVVVGSCKLPVQDLEPTAGELRQLYVRAEFRNFHFGSRLLETALAWLESRQRTPLYVGVWSENFAAQRLYARYGFEKAGEHSFRVGKTVDRDLILRRARP
jgi:diamine N-acetyltransferase